MSRLGELDAAADLLKQLLADADAGVRRMALRGLSTPLPPALAGSVQTASQPPGPLDPVNAGAASVAQQAAALLARQPGGLAFGESLLFAVINYGQARLNELRAAVLDDVTVFVTATGGVVDGAGAVAAKLAAAIGSLNTAVPKLEAKDFSGAAADLGIALGAVDAAAKLSGGPHQLIDLLQAKVGWSGVSATGLVKALGLPAAPPALSVEAGALVYKLSAPPTTILGAPKVGFDAAVLTARAADRCHGRTGAGGVPGHRGHRGRRRGAGVGIADRRRLGPRRHHPRRRHDPRADDRRKARRRRSCSRRSRASDRWTSVSSASSCRPEAAAS